MTASDNQALGSTIRSMETMDRPTAWVADNPLERSKTSQAQDPTMPMATSLSIKAPQQNSVEALIDRDLHLQEKMKSQALGNMMREIMNYLATILFHTVSRRVSREKVMVAIPDQVTTRFLAKSQTSPRIATQYRTLSSGMFENHSKSIYLLQTKLI